ncbi:MAG: hypothetical protein N2114_00565, partial [Candidatus Goldbacteria bacterium]|nr:hypothetical protein [Candidatus Goldiibacteriota bacterium]
MIVPKINFIRFLKIVLIIIVIFWIGIEFIAFIFMPPIYPSNPNTNFIEKSLYFSNSKEFKIITNNYGFRNSANFKFPFKDSSNKRILFVGDSFMFGGPNNKTIDYFLKKKLPDFEIFNAGSPGNDINGYYEIVKYYLNKINPDYLFVGLFLGND